MNLAIITAHAGADSLQDAILSWGTWGGFPMPTFDFKDNDLVASGSTYVADGRNGMLTAYERGWREAAKDGYDILAHCHDDLLILEQGWAERVMAEFEDPKVGLVGFCGALVHGSPDLYKSPYEHTQLGRSYVLSNMEEAEVHGERFTGSCDVAVLDGFALIVRRELLVRAGGWPVSSLGDGGYIAYDYALCCMAHRLGYRIRLVGVRCLHMGGRTAVALKKNLDPHGEKYHSAHRWVYESFADVLPWSCLP